MYHNRGTPVCTTHPCYANFKSLTTKLIAVLRKEADRGEQLPRRLTEDRGEVQIPTGDSGSPGFPSDTVGNASYRALDSGNPVLKNLIR